MISLFGLLALLGIAYWIGRTRELNHLDSLFHREVEYASLPFLTDCVYEEYSGKIDNPQLVSASVVISGDYFKHFWASLRNIFGGSIVPYELLLDRARREAKLRLQEKARQLGANAVINGRLATSMVGYYTVEVMVYGTAVHIKKEDY